MLHSISTSEVSLCYFTIKKTPEKICANIASYLYITCCKHQVKSKPDGSIAGETMQMDFQIFLKTPE